MGQTNKPHGKYRGTRKRSYRSVDGNGEDLITVRLHANLLDYTVDAKSGAVVNGSNSDPIQFQEYWTISRPVGPNSWKLTAVQQA